MRRLGLTVVLCLAVAAGACSEDDAARSAATTVPDATSSTAATDASTTTAGESSSTTDEAAAPAIALRGDGLGVVALGASLDAAVAAVTGELGEPTFDSGWQPSSGTSSTCPGEEIRGVEWDGLVLLFTDGDTAFGTGEHFFSWRVTGAPPAVGTAGGLGYGATAADAEEQHPGAVERVAAEEPFPAFLQIQAEGGPITAFLDDSDTITNLEAGAACGE